MWRPSHTLKVATHTYAQTEREQAHVVQRQGGMRTRPTGVLPARLSQPYGQPTAPARLGRMAHRRGRTRKGRRGGPDSGPPLTPGAGCPVPQATHLLARAERPWHGLEVHVTAAWGGRCLVLLRLLHDHCLGGEEETGDGSGVLQRGP